MSNFRPEPPDYSLPISDQFEFLRGLPPPPPHPGPLLPGKKPLVRSVWQLDWSVSVTVHKCLAANMRRRKTIVVVGTFENNRMKTRRWELMRTEREVLWERSRRQREIEKGREKERETESERMRNCVSGLNQHSQRKRETVKTEKVSHGLEAMKKKMQIKTRVRFSHTPLKSKCACVCVRVRERERERERERVNSSALVTFQAPLPHRSSRMWSFSCENCFFGTFNCEPSHSYPHSSILLRCFSLTFCWELNW